MRLLSLSIIIAVSFFSVNSYAQMTNIGSFGSAKSYGSTISGNGVVIGINRYSGSSDFTTAILYNNGSTTEVPALGGTYSLINGISNDGSVAVGYASNGSGKNLAIKYTTSAGSQSIGTLSGGDESWAMGVSDDGSIIVGFANDASSGLRAFKYTSLGGMVDIGSLQGNATDASTSYAVSGDGNVIVGDSGTSISTSHAFKYTDSGGMVDLGTFGGATSNARATSYDGSVTVGYSYYFGDSIVHAFKHTDAGGLDDLGTLGGTKSFAMDVSSDGSIAVGYSTDSSGNNKAFKHNDVDGMESLGTLGGDNSYAYSVSDDGSIIVGSSETSSGGVDTFIYKITEVTTSTTSKMVNLDKTVETLYENNNQLNSIFNIKNSLIKSTLKQDCTVFGKNNICVGLGLRYSNVDNHNASDQATNLVLAYKINDNLRVGTIIDQTLEDSMPSEFKTTNFMPTIGVFGDYNSKKDQSGINFRIAATFDDVKTTINRKKYQYTEAGSGSSNISSYGLLAELSYKAKISEKLSIKPSLGIRKTKVSREGYQEYSNIDFPIRYESVTQEMTTGVMGLKANYLVNTRLSVNLGLEYEDNFERRMDSYVGSVEGIGSFNMNPYNVRKNTISIDGGVGYKVGLNKKIVSTVSYGQQAFNDANNTTIYLNYLMGF